MSDKAETRARAKEGAIPDAAVPATAGQLIVPAPIPSPLPAIPAPKRWSKWLWPGLVVVGLAAALWYFQPWVSKGLPVTVETVTPSPLTRILAVNGQIAPLHQVDVKPVVGGEVFAVLVDEGELVAAGDVLARIESTQQQAAVRQALAGLDAGLVAQGQAQADYVRAKALGGNITRAALEDAESAQKTADQEVARLTALMQQAEIELENYTILAPLAGTILSRDAEMGQVVDKATVMFSMADLGQLVVETDVDETYATRVTPGLAAVLQLTGGIEKLDGSVSSVAPKVDAATGGLAVKIAFDAPVAAPVGLTVTANIIVDQEDAAISVPRAAVVSDVTGSVVYIAVAGIAERRAVTVVDWPAVRIEVTSGLRAGDVVITDATGVSDAAAIDVSTAPAASGP